jgi:hypothetical protein
MDVLARLWWVPALVGAGLVARVDAHGDAGDVIFFAHAGEKLFESGWENVYADPVLQSGPIQLAVLGALSHLADSIDVSLGTVLAYSVELAAMVAVLQLLKRITAHRGVLFLGSLAALVCGVSSSAFIDGHPAQLFIPLLWVVASLAVRRGEPGWAGVLVGLSAGLELWGVLGICIFAASPTARFAARGLGAAALVAAALFAPFVYLGDFAMFEYSWSVASGTVVAVLVEPGSSYSWAVRVVQAGAAVGAGGAVAWALRRRSAVVWAAPFAAVLVRLVFDPVFYAAYLVAPLTLALVAAVEFLTGDLIREARAPRYGRPVPGQGAVGIRR